ncbi:leucine-rich repeat receptor serine/threonine-protein [Salix suchowensis]|nr:leucine-rich repeat receptor serine/threonine-protein [Salix suchowensis]
MISSVTSLHCYDLSGRLPPDLANLTYVRKIDFTRNYLYGTIPVEWASMKNLSSIELKNFLLTQVTNRLCSSLTANRLSGNIPGYLGNFPALTYLSLESNQFYGAVPPELGKLARLETLILSSNKLVGTLPEELAQIKDLGDFRVSDNNLNGTVPEFIGSWTQLRRLGLCATGFQGPIPRAIFLMENLTDLKISDTPGPEFPLPKVPNKMKYFDLTFNKLVGELPRDTIRREFTFLSGNLLTGTVQDSFIQSNIHLYVPQLHHWILLFDY